MQRFSALSLLLILSALPLAAADGGPAEMVTAIDCAGGYLQLDLADRAVVSRGGIWEHPSMTALRPPSTSHFDGCLVAAVAADSERGRLYAALARDSFVSPRGTRRYQLVALSLPSLEQVASVDLGAEIDGSIALLLAPDQGHLLASYTVVEGVGGRVTRRSVIDRFALPDLTRQAPSEPARPIAEKDSDPLYTNFQAGSFWDKSGRIVDRTKILDPEGKVLHRFNAYQLLDAATREKFRPLELAGAAGPYLPIALAEVAAERALFVVAPDLSVRRAEASGLRVHDLQAGVTLARIATPFPVAAFDPTRRATPTAHLTPDGDGVLVEHFEWRSPAAPESDPMAAEVRFKTGRLDLYDAASGYRLRTFELEPAPGAAGRVAGFSPDSSIVLVGTHERLYVVDLSGETPPWAAATGGELDGFWLQGVVFSSRSR